MELLGLINLLISIGGGILARFKKDYFLRGFFICIFTGVFGFLAILFSPISAVREGNEVDEHEWPRYGGYAVLGMLATIILGFIITY